MKRITGILILILSAFAVKAQTPKYQGPWTPMTGRGYQFKDIKVDSGFNSLKSAHFADSVFLKGYAVVNQTPPVFDSSLRLVNTGYLKRTISALNVSGLFDTSYRRLDSVFYKKAGTEYFAYKDSTGGGSTDTTSLSNRINQRMDSLRNNSGVLEARKNGVFVPQFTLPSGGGGTPKVYAPLVVSGDSISQRFNIFKYGAIPNDGLDDTGPIQAAINAAATAHVGIVFAPTGTYHIDGPIITSYNGYDPNSQLVIPMDTVSNYIQRQHIKIIGESVPNFTVMGSNSTTLPSSSGTIFYSRYTGSRSATVPGTAIIGANGPDLGGVGNGVNLNYLTVENIVFRVKNNPNGAGPEIGGVNGRHIASTRIYNSIFSVDTSGFETTNPTRDVAGFETSDCNLETDNSVVNSSAYGVKRGFVFGEHVSADLIQARHCLYGITFKKGNHASNINRALVQASRYALGYYDNGSGCQADLAAVTIDQLDIEWHPAATQWFKSQYAVNDSLNKIVGNLRYWVSVGYVGGAGNTSWVVNGATRMQSDSIGKATGGGASNWTVTGSDIYRNSKVGINMTPAADFDVLGFSRFINSNGISDGQLAIRDNSGTPNFLTIGAKYLNGWPTLNSSGANSLSLATNDVTRLTLNGSTGAASFTNNEANAISLTGSNAGRVSYVAQNTNSAGNTSFYFQNDRGGFASYGGILHGGSAFGGSWFGSSRSDKTILFSDGLSTGLTLGTLNSSPVTIGTNNTARLIIPATGIPEHADNAAAVAAGLAIGTIYRTGDLMKIVH